jgi:hypothetical protein
MLGLKLLNIQTELHSYRTEAFILLCMILFHPEAGDIIFIRNDNRLLENYPTLHAIVQILHTSCS